MYAARPDQVEPGGGFGPCPGEQGGGEDTAAASALEGARGADHGSGASRKYVLDRQSSVFELPFVDQLDGEVPG